MKLRSKGNTMATTKKLEKQGYRITSRSGRYATRIDREDWKEFMQDKGLPESPDLYRRVYSKDTIIVSHKTMKEMKNSGGSDIGYKAI